MILILTSESGDLSHLEIVNWLEYYKANYLVVTGESIIRGAVDFTYSSLEGIIYKGKPLRKQVSAVYYRRWVFPSEFNLCQDKILNHSLVSNLFNEAIEIRNLLFYELKDAKWYPSPQVASVNKLQILDMARTVGLRVPATIVTNKKEDLLEFYSKCNEEVVTKAIGNYSVIVTSDQMLYNPIYTRKLNINDLPKIPDLFVSTLFQECIDKSFELRIFIFEEHFYTTALMSQQHERTKIDSRITQNFKGSKLVPYDLPDDIKVKLNSLFNLVGLNIGSVDMIVSAQGEFYFLEVNPVGQISGYSRRACLNIEKDIVERLIEIDERD